MFESFQGVRLLGVDYSEQSIRLAEGMNVGLNIDFRCVNLLENNISDRFDAATLIEVYEHIHPDITEKFIETVHNLLAKNGFLHITVPHKNMPVSSKHFRHFTVSGLTQEFEKYFEIVEVVPFEK
ncbi:MAG: class I SAM-dependent methyltransferase [Candidatus Brocadiaceae bacterium]|nr:class I SAM-dependent methyltransferase [Candidatus Brocadiaceae bacterium]